MSALSSDARRSVVRWSLVIAWAAVIFRLSALPGSSVPGHFGTYAHFGVYAVLAALALHALADPSRWLRAVALASAYGVTDELHQLFVPGRVADPVDWVVDTLGALTGALLIAWWLRRRGADS